MQWIDHATDVEARVKVKLAEDPNYQEAWMPGLSWRSEDFKWRVNCDDRNLPAGEWTWTIFDMRQVAQPWGPQDCGDGQPLPLVRGVTSLAKALLIANLCAESRLSRFALGGFKVAMDSLRGLSGFLHRELDS